MAPVVYALISNGINAKHIILIDAFPDKTLKSLSEDQRVYFLKELGVDFRNSSFIKVYVNLLVSILEPLPIPFVGKVLRRILVSKIFQNMISKSFLKHLDKRIRSLDSAQNDVLLVENGNSELNFLISSFAKENFLKIVALPNGLVTHNGLRDRELDTKLFKSNEEEINFDLIIYPNKLSVPSHKVNDENIMIPGSARFCKEWVSELSNIYNKEDKPLNQNKNILLLAEKDGRYINGEFIPDIYHEKIREITLFLDSLKSINLVIKHHPKRTGSFGTDDMGPYASENATHIYKDNQKTTFQLIRESDLVISTFSSAAIDAMFTNKPLLITDFASPYKLAYKEFLGEWSSNSLEDFKLFIEKFLNEELEVPAQEFAKFLKEHVSNEASTLKNYYQILHSL